MRILRTIIRWAVSLLVGLSCLIDSFNSAYTSRLMVDAASRQLETGPLYSMHVLHALDLSQMGMAGLLIAGACFAGVCYLNNSIGRTAGQYA